MQLRLVVYTDLLYIAQPQKGQARQACELPSLDNKKARSLLLNWSSSELFTQGKVPYLTKSTSTSEANYPPTKVQGVPFFQEQFAGTVSKVLVSIFTQR